MTKYLRSVFLLWLALGAGAAAATEFSTYRAPGGESSFAADYPAWSSKKSGNPFNVVSVVHPDRQCYFDLDKSDAPLEQFRPFVRKYMQERGATITSPDPLAYEFKTGDGKYAFVAKTRGIDCGAKSYLATMTCVKESYDQAAADRAFASMACGTTPIAPKTTPAPPAAPAAPAAAAPAASSVAKAGGRPLVGVVVSPAGEFNARNVQDAFRIARDGGAQVSRTFVAWNDIESRKGKRDWQGTDYMMGLVRNHGLRLAVSFNVIHTAIRGPLPNDVRFKGWDDPELIDRFGDFALAFVERYSDIVDYVELGNEVNAYFARHDAEVAAYRAFFVAVSGRIKQKFPGVKVGMTYAFHEMQARNDYSIYERLRAGDYDGFTLYVYGKDFRFDRPAKDLVDSLDQIAKLTGTRQFAVDEVGWSAAPSLRGSDAAQRDAVAATFDFLDRAPPRLLFLAWFSLHDGRRQDCDRMARTFVNPGDAMGGDAKAMRTFSDYLCNLGLRTNDGESRTGWDEWVRRAKAFRAK